MHDIVTHVCEEVKLFFSSSLNSSLVLKRVMAITLKCLGCSSSDVGKLVNMHRARVDSWYARYQEQGLVGLLDKPRSGRPKKLQEEDYLAIENEFFSSAESDKTKEITTGKTIVRFLRNRRKKKISLSTVYRKLRKRRYSYQTPRPQHIKNDPVVMEQWKQDFSSHLSKLNEKNKSKKTIEVWYQDETRYGQKTIVSKIWSQKGIRPVYKNQMGYKNAWIYGAINPTTGEKHGLILPALDAENMQIYVDTLSKVIGASRKIVLVLDGSKAHRNGLLKKKRNIEFYFLPPYSPQLNPIERLWLFIKKKYLAFKLYKDMDEIINTGVWAWNKPSAKMIKSICAVH